MGENEGGREQVRLHIAGAIIHCIHRGMYICQRHEPCCGAHPVCAMCADEGLRTVAGGQEVGIRLLGGVDAYGGRRHGGRWELVCLVPGSLSPGDTASTLLRSGRRTVGRLTISNALEETEAQPDNAGTLGQPLGQLANKSVSVTINASFNEPNPRQEEQGPRRGSSYCCYAPVSRSTGGSRNARVNKNKEW